MNVRPLAVIVGGSESQASLLEAFRRLGCTTCVVDGSDRAPLLERSDHAIVRDFTNVDAVASAIRRAGLVPSAIATMGSDAAVVPTADLCARFGTSGLSPDAARRVCDKERTRAAFRSAGVPCTEGAEVASLDQLERAYAALGPHAVVKPVDGSGQRGVTEVRDAGTLDAAWNDALTHSPASRVVVERYLDGLELTVSGFVVDGAYHPVMISERVLFPAPPLGVCRAHRYPSGIGSDAERNVFAIAEAATRAVDVRQGPSYVQVRRADDTVVAIEIGARLGGGKDAELAELVTGIDQITAVAELALGRPVHALRSGAPTHPCGQVWFTVREPGRVKRLSTARSLALPGVIDAGFYYRPEMDYPPFANGAGRLGYLIVVADSLAALEEHTARADSELETGILTPDPVP